MANVKDAATGTVLTAPSPALSGTSLTLNSGEGDRFPAAPFYAVAYQNNTIPTASTAEKILVTAKVGDVFTIARTQGDVFTNQSILVNWRVSNAIFADDLNNASIVSNEVPGGSVNGSNTVFTVASAGKVTGSLRVHKNGIRLKGGGEDFTETTTGFTMVAAPATNTVLLVDYIVAGALTNVGTNSLITDEAVTGTVNGSNTIFTTARAYIGGSLEVYINGLKQYRTTDYAETTPGSGIFTFTTAPLTGDVIRVAYQYNLNPSSNSDTVDGLHASATPTPNMLVPLNSSGVFPTAVLGGAWASWVPTLTNFSGTVVAAKYILVGKICHFYIEVTQGASVTGRHTFSLPVTASSSISTSLGWGSPIARGTILDFGAQAYDAVGGLVSSTTCGLLYTLAVANIVTQAPTSATVPMTWVNGSDKFWLYGTYETA